MPKLTIEEAGQLGLLGPEELAAIGYNPFTPRAGASWTPQLGVRPGLTSSSFFRYPSLYQRPGISSLRFGLGGLRQGLTLSPESPALGLGGVAAPVGAAARRSPSRGIAGGIAGGRAAIGSEGSGNLPTMTLPDGRRLVRLPDGRVMIVGGQRPPIQADTPEGYAALQTMGLISQGIGGVREAARLFDHLTKGGEQPTQAEVAAAPGQEPGLLRPASLQQGPQSPADALLAPQEVSPEDLAAALGISEQDRGQQITGDSAAPGLVPSGPGMQIDLNALPPSLLGENPPATLDALFRGEISPEDFDAIEQLPTQVSDVSPGYVYGGTQPNLEGTAKPRLDLTPEEIMAMLPAPAAGRADTAPRGLGPRPSDIFEPEAAGGGPGLNLNVGNVAGLGQSLLGVGQAGITRDPGQLIGALLRSGMSTNQLARIPGLNQAGINAGLGGALGVLNLIQSARAGNIPGAIGGGLSTLGSAANFGASIPGGALGLSQGALGAVGAGAAGAGGLLSLATGIQGLIKGGTPPLQSALSLAGGMTSTYSALASLSQMYPNLFGAVLPTISQLAGSGLTAVGLPGVASALGLGGAAAAGLGAGTAAAAAAGAAPASIGAAAMGGSVAGGAATGIGSAIAPILSTVGVWAGPVAAIVQAITDSIAEMERQRAQNAGFTNNPIKGALYSQATESVARANEVLNAIQKTGDLSAVSTADLGKVLTSATNNLMPYYATAQGGRGAIKASDTITGAGADWAAKPYAGGQTPEEYTRNAETAKAGIAGLVKELMKRGVTYEQIGQLPVSGDWASESLDAGGTPSEYYGLNENKYNEEMKAILSRASNYGYTTPEMIETAPGQMTPTGKDTFHPFLNLPPEAYRFGPQGNQALLNAALGASMKGPAEVTKASGLMTAMYGGPFWAAIARSGIPGANPDLAKLIQEHFDPWVSARTWSAQQILDSFNQNFNPLTGEDIPTSGGGWWAPGYTPPRGVAYEQAREPLSTLSADQRAAALAAPNFWEDLAKQQAQTQVPPSQSGPTAFNPLNFLSALEAGQRAQIQSGQDTLTFVPYKPDQAPQFTAPDSGYQQIGEGFYAKASGQGNGAEIYVPQDRTVDLGKALAGYQGGPPVAGQIGTLLSQPPVPAGQEAGATPGAGPATDIAPSPVPVGTAATTAQGTAPNPTDAAGGTGVPIPGTGFEKGGTVPETGRYTLHAGEVVVPAGRADEAPADVRGRGPVRLAHHEQSETVQDADGRWINVYGRDIKDKAGQPLPYEGNSYDTVEEAVDAARRRSQDEGKAGRTEVPKEKGWYVHLSEGVPSQKLDGTDPMVRRLAFTPDEVEQAINAGEAPIMVGKGVLGLPPSALRGFLQKAQNMQNKDPMKSPAMVAMGNRIRKSQEQVKPEGDTMPYPGLGEQNLRGNRPRFSGDRGRGADIPLDSMPARPPDFGPSNPERYRMLDVLPKATPTMPTIPMAPQPGPLQTNSGPGLARAMRLAQGPQGPAEDFARQDRMLEGIDRGTIAPSTLSGASREQRLNLTPQDIMRRPSNPGEFQPPQPSLLERARRLVTG